jgi:uncharacterized protein with PQ loop repeat
MAFFWQPKVKKDNRWLTFFISIVAVASPALTIPQVYLIFSTKMAQGISVVTWLGYVVTSSIWLWYGIAHQERPIVVSSLAGGLLALLVVWGALIYG